jgi:demethylmenaquinone methyltransferase/2-methoxy-6-polyprenyl-1,4-benzoquinol methylase
VDDPAATLHELARVVRPGARIAMLEFFLPANQLARMCWEGYVRFGLPLLGGRISPGWGAVGTFLGSSVRTFWAAHPPEQLLDHWRAAGIEGVQARTLTVGGGIVMWGTRGC